MTLSIRDAPDMLVMFTSRVIFCRPTSAPPRDADHNGPAALAIGAHAVTVPLGEVVRHATLATPVGSHARARIVSVARCAVKLNDPSVKSGLVGEVMSPAGHVPTWATPLAIRSLSTAVMR